MTDRLIEDERDAKRAAQWVLNHKRPYVLKLTSGRMRSVEQNRLQRLWMNEIAEQLGDRTPEEVRGECKLAFGVAILCAENNEFRVAYERDIAPLPYHVRLALMMLPHDYGVTRLMTSKQKKQYLDAVNKHFAALGLILTQPDDQGLRAA